MPVVGSWMWEIHLRHEGLQKYRHIRGNDRHVVLQKAAAQEAAWEEMWRKRLERLAHRQARERASRERESKKELAAEKTAEVERKIDELTSILRSTLDVDDRLDWNRLKQHLPFTEAKPTLQLPPAPSRPTPVLPPAPDQNDPKYRPSFSLVDKMVRSRREQVEQEAEARFASATAEWKRQVTELTAQAESEYDARLRSWRSKCAQGEASYNAAVFDWEKRKEAFELRVKDNHAAVDAQKAAYESRDPRAVLEYCDLVLGNSSYPDEFPQEFELDFAPDSGILLIEYRLPNQDVIPEAKAFKYNAARDELLEAPLSQAQRNKIYDDLLYQITLRSVHEVFEGDYVEAVDAVVYNGWVNSVDKATGRETTACILSLQTSRDQFMSLDLARVDPKACFKSLKGVGSSKLHGLAPVAPILTMKKDDKRFVESYGVIQEVEHGANLAAMDWEDFEHLIRELFEKEFAASGAEVKVTRASRDAGVDAVVFDPDPIRGGKIVIQAKRYVNTVDVSAVRDLYGAVLNEGANKGILVTTADYGPDAYDFATGKPLSLLNGANLLHLLGKHGHHARIDLVEARKELGLRVREKSSAL